MKQIITDAVTIGNTAARANNSYPRGDLTMVYFYQDKLTEWVMAYP